MFKQPVMPVVSLNGVSVKFAGQVSHLGAGFLNRGPRQPLGATERLSRGHEQRFFANQLCRDIAKPKCDNINYTSVEGGRGPQTTKG